MHAVFGLITAADCMLRGVHSALKAGVGSEGVFQVGIVGADSTGRCFDGSEDVTAYMTGMTVVESSVYSYLVSIANIQLILLLSSVSTFGK